jgi:hypothetical protein
LREERRLKVFENRVLRRTFWSKRDEVQGSGENCIMKSLMISTAYVKIFWVIKSRRMGWAGHVARIGERRGVSRFLVWKPR